MDADGDRTGQLSVAEDLEPAARILERSRREERFERVMRGVVSKRTAKFLDERVIPQPQRGMKSVPPRRTQLWQKFWLLDDPARRTAFLAEHARAVASGAVRASIAPRLTE